MKASKTDAPDRFTAVRAAKTSGEYRSAIADLGSALRQLEQEHAEAERQRDRAILDGGDMAALRNRVFDLATEVSEVRTAIAEATRRQGEAEQRERETETADLRAEAESVGAELGEAYRRFDAALAVFREEHATTDRLKQRLERVNASLESRGHSQLRVKPAAIRDAAGEFRQAQSVHGLSRNAQRLDELLRDIGTARMAIRVNPRHRRVGNGVEPLAAR